MAARKPITSMASPLMRSCCNESLFLQVRAIFRVRRGPLPREQRVVQIPCSEQRICGAVLRWRQTGSQGRPEAPFSGTSPGCGWTRAASVMHNECMPLIQIRDVPEPVRDELSRKAAAAGQSMQAYLLAELSKLAERPSMAEIVARAQARARATGSTVTMDDAVAAVRAARDRQEP